MTEKQTKHPARPTEADYETLERITPIAELLSAWGKIVDDEGEMKVESGAVLASMSNSLWGVYFNMCQRLEVFE
ncbi:MAG: hypothetical protein JRJ34_03885 [Deltaproteobacteria bacterium]|nr:hypothetical protein [Deltaproteobacteria bacterium]